MAKGTLRYGVQSTIHMTEQAEADGNTAAQGQLWVNTAVPNELYFTTDADDDIAITSGTSIVSGFNADAAQTFNDTGAAVDFRIESDDNANMFFLDGSEDKIGIGTSAPTAALDVVGEVVMRNNAIRNPRFQAWVMGG